MSKSYVPGANRTAQYWANKFRGSTMNTNCACLHTTEGFTWPGYSGGASAPHLTILPNIAAKTVTMRQHYPAGKSARALVNLSGGVETNTLNVFQIELVGTCDSRHAKTWLGRKAGVDYIYWPDAPQWLLDAIAPVFRWLDAVWPNFQVADAAPRGWAKYPDSYGINAKQRMTSAEWRNAYGIFGHQHVPENAHGDPGNFPIAKLLDAIGGTATPKPPKYKTVRWHGIAFLNTWGDDGGKGQASFNDRTPAMTADLTRNRDEIVAACEVRKEQEPGFTKAMKARGYVLAGYSHRLAFYALPDVKVGRLSFYRYRTQNKGAIEGILRLRAKVNGHWNHYGVTHLDYRDDFDNGRVKQGKEAVSAMRRLGLRYLLTRVDRSVILGDLNSKTWVLERALEPGGYFDTARSRKPQHSSMVAKKGDDRIDYITTGDKRPVMDSEQITTKSDHRIERCVLGKNVKA